MSLSEKMVIDYLIEVTSLKAINNHDVKDSEGNKTGQMPLSIKICKDQIDAILEQDQNREKELLTVKEYNSLIELQEALDNLPSSMGFQSLLSIISFDDIQKRLLESVTNYIANITQFEDHELLLKALVLVLKIIEYDLSKKPGPITIGSGFFKVEVLSDEQRIENHGQVVQLLTDIFKNFEARYKQETALAVSNLS